MVMDIKVMGKIWNFKFGDGGTRIESGGGGLFIIYIWNTILITIL